MSTTTDVAGEYRLIEIGRLHESPLNPRKLFAEGPLQELAASIRESGIITPLIVRPNAKGYEIAAGHRRYRAAKLAELATLPTIVREMDDKTFVEILNVENLQRQDMTPLEEAEGYRLLMTKASYKVERIAERVGRSVQYVYDRVKLLELIPDAVKLLREDRITAGHAILLARLKPADQKRTIDVDTGGLFEEEYSLDDPESQDSRRKLLDDFKPKSVRELDAWIAEHVRFDAAVTDPMVFPETAQALAEAKETEEKVVKITYEHHIQPEARDPKERTIVPTSWERADGKHGSKTCEHAVIGVVVVGPGRGESFKVCLAKEKCVVHWSTWQKARERRAKEGGRSAASTRSSANSWEKEQAKRQAEQQRCDAVLPAIYKLLAEKVKKAPAGAKGVLGKMLLDIRNRGEALKYMPLGTSADDLVRFLAFDAMTERPDTWDGLRAFTALCKPFGIDVKKSLAAADKAKKDEKGATADRAPAAAAAKKSKRKKK